MADVEKPITFGATVEQPKPTHETTPLRSPPSNESDLSAMAATRDAADPSNPFSAFYRHPDARRSMEMHRNSNSKTHLDVYERDLEAGTPLSAATTANPKVSVDGRVKECTMWPTHQTMVQKKKATQRQRACNLFRNLNSKQRLWVKIGIALFIVALAVGLGIGISRAVGGGVWAGNGKSKEIPNN
jgi:hypothetical protein